MIFKKIYTLVKLLLSPLFDRPIEQKAEGRHGKKKEIGLEEEFPDRKIIIAEAVPVYAQHNQEPP